MKNHVAWYRKPMVTLIPLVLLFLVSLLAVYRAPTYHLWLLSIAVTEFSWVFALLAIILISTIFWVQKYQLASTLIGIAALVLYLSPVVRAYVVSSTLKQEFNAAFGPGSTFIRGDNTQSPFSFFKMFKGLGHGDVAYQTKEYINIDGERLTLDFYPARVAGKKPCLVVVHGGSWSSGNSKQLPELNSYLANEGYNVAAINYRMAPQYHNPAPIEDVNNALDYLRLHAEELHIDTNNFVLLGRSAGGQVAMLAAYTQHNPGVKGVIDIYGPADMAWGYSLPASKLVMDSRGVMHRYLGGTYKKIPQKYKASSPIEYVNKHTVPTLLIHGENDVLVSPGHSTRLVAKLQQNGVKHYYLKLPWATHGFDYTMNGPGGQLSTYTIERFLSVVCK